MDIERHEFEVRHLEVADARAPRCLVVRAKGLADRAGVWLCVYWCSIERASVREFMSAAEKLWF